MAREQMWDSAHHLKVDDNFSGQARDVLYVDLIAEMTLQLLQQRQGIVIIAKTHGFAGVQGRERAKDGSVPEPLGDTACVKWVNGIRKLGVGGSARHDHILVKSEKIVT